MKEYPKILGVEESPCYGEQCVAFNKLDGSNLRFEWSNKQGWYKFGTRNLTIDRSQPTFGPGIDLFINKYGEAIEKVMRDKFPKVPSCICYAEYFGPYTFGGVQEDDWLKKIGLLPEGATNSKKDIVLFDVNPYLKCFLSPEQFIKLFGHLHIPEVVYRGKLTEEFFQDVRHGKYGEGEGVVCKGGERHKLWMRKIKTLTYLHKLMEVFGTGWGSYWE